MSISQIQIFRLMHDQIESPHFHYTDEARKIIESGAQRSESRHETLLLIEQIARTGNYSFTHVYDQYVGGEIRYAFALHENNSFQRVEYDFASIRFASPVSQYHYWTKPSSVRTLDDPDGNDITSP